MANSTIFGTQQDFGKDIAAYPDLDPSFGIISGNRVMSEMVIRRLITVPGSVADDASFGTDIRKFLNFGMQGLSGSAGQGTLYRMKQDIEKELIKDQRVQGATATLTYNATATTTQPANSIYIKLDLDTNAGPFSLELSITAVTLALLKTG